MNKVEYFKKKCEVLREIFVGSYLNKILELTSTDYYFSFSKGKKKAFILSLALDNPTIINTEQSFTSNNSTHFYKTLKTKILNARFNDLYLLDDDNIIVFEFVKTSDTYDKIKYLLVFEAFKSYTNLILLRGNKIELAYRYHGLDTNHPVVIGATYLAPLKIESFKEIDEDKQRNLENKYLLEINNKYLKEKYKSTISLIKRKKKSLEKKLMTLEDEKVKAHEKLSYKDYGDHFLTIMNEIKRGASSFIYEDKEIDLKETLSPSQNLEYLYKTYKKAKMTIESMDKYIKETQNELNYINGLLEQITLYNEEEYLQLINELKENKIIRVRVNQTMKMKKDAHLPYFIEFMDTKIAFGKNRIQNEYLTFSLAKKGDYFLHLNKEHGSHVIIFDNNPSSDVINFAAELALFLSNKPLGEVLFARVQDVKKGKSIGATNVLKYETYFIKEFKNDILSYFKTAQKD